MNGIIRKTPWALMSFLAVGVAGYALAMVLVPGSRGEFVVDMFADDPLATHAHLLGGAIALSLGAFQFSQRLRTRHLGLHRWMGRTYVIAVAIGGVAGLYMALTTPGGSAAQFGFSCMAIAWLITTAMAYIRIRQKDVLRHRMWMVRSYAVTLAAVTLRFYFPIGLMNGYPFESVYPVLAWICWVPNLLIAEWVLLPIMNRRPVH